MTTQIRPEYTMALAAQPTKPLLVEIVRFFKTRKPPVSAEETREILAFMEATDQSKSLGGCPITLESVIQQARQQTSQLAPTSQR